MGLDRVLQMILDEFDPKIEAKKSELESVRTDLDVLVLTKEDRIKKAGEYFNLLEEKRRATETIKNFDTAVVALFEAEAGKDASVPADGDTPVPAEEEPPVPAEEATPSPAEEATPSPAEEATPSPAEEPPSPAEEPPSPAEEATPSPAEEPPSQGDGDTPAQTEGEIPQEP